VEKEKNFFKEGGLGLKTLCFYLLKTQKGIASIEDVTKVNAVKHHFFFPSQKFI
jgi:hypothetical protein